MLAEIISITGIITAVLLLVVLLKAGRGLLDDLFGSCLLLGLLLGLLIADINWAYLALAIILYCGTPLLIRANLALGKHAGFLGQRA
jgi:hypothetical protein